MLSQDVQLLESFVRTLRQERPEARVWAYGSRVRETATEESDLDLCVVVDTLDRATEDRIREIAWEEGFAHGLVISVLCYASGEFFSGPRSASPLVRTILREGMVA
ncbi:MAG: nucleotidyltransferase domain-containing protein [Magnetococcales bacterium]|nr:nucleotidyltransferase domain-containing protein [Magnetococcales bacterium]